MGAPRITVADIDKWNPDDIDRVFQVCTQHAGHCDDRASDLGSLTAFESWDGDAATAAAHSVGRTRSDFDSHGQHVAAIADAAKTAATEVATVKSKLSTLRTSAGQQGFAIGADGTVREVRYGPFTAAEKQTLAAERTALQLEVNQLLVNAQIADSDLAAAINGADGTLSTDQLARRNHTPIYADVFGLGSLGIPDYPDGSLTDVQTRAYYNAAEQRIAALMKELANDPDLSLAERAEIGWGLRNELRTHARELMADQDLAARLFADRPNAGFEELVQDKMTRKGLTREQALQDIVDTASKSNAEVNAALGIDPKTAQFPDPKDVHAKPGAVTGEDIGAAVAGDSKLLTGVRIAGRIATPIAAAATVYDDYQQVRSGQESVPQAVGHSTGTIGGMIGGAEAGAALGTLIGPEGTVVGGVVGGIVGGVAGAIGGGKVGKWIGGLF